MIKRFRIWLEIWKAKRRQKNLPTKQTEVQDLEYVDDIMEYVSDFVMKEKQTFWIAHVLYQVKSVRKDGKIILKVIGARNGKTIIRGHR